MTSPAFEIPSTPLPASHSATHNVHRLYRPSPTVLLLRPGRSLWAWTLVLLAFVPIVWGVCTAWALDARLTLGLSLMPLVAAAGFAGAGLIYHLFGTRVRFDRDTQRISITGFRHGKGNGNGKGQHYPLAKVRGVQFCDVGIKENTETSWHAFQVNLVMVASPDVLVPARINLLESGGEAQLRDIARGIADFLGVPLYTGGPARPEST